MTLSLIETPMRHQTYYGRLSYSAQERITFRFRSMANPLTQTLQLAPFILIAALAT
jgi:hypothetical protein